MCPQCIQLTLTAELCCSWPRSWQKLTDTSGDIRFSDYSLLCVSQWSNDKFKTPGGFKRATNDFNFWLNLKNVLVKAFNYVSKCQLIVIFDWSIFYAL